MGGLPAIRPADEAVIDPIQPRRAGRAKRAGHSNDAGDAVRCRDRLTVHCELDPGRIAQQRNRDLVWQNIDERAVLRATRISHGKMHPIEHVGGSLAGSWHSKRAAGDSDKRSEERVSVSVVMKFDVPGERRR